MKNFVLAAVSGFALIAATSLCAQGEEKKGADQAAPDAMAPVAADKKAPTPEKKAPVASHKHHGKHHAHKGHPHKHHHHRGEARTEVNGVFVAFPPVDARGVAVIVPEYYAGKRDCPYMYHGGYFWYPHTRADMMPGYTPHCANNACWYASYAHPHRVYVEGENMVFVLPNSMDGAMYRGRMAPMEKKWESAPEMESAQ
ncbi:MAG: hypothetical protein K2P93_00540 [Alphaproteobacteria bacterium]|nr:hypothetical protein [Alphaproteobacteria bacterium]